jgi:enoyl-CoA hydratase/carnithine racemase
MTVGVWDAVRASSTRAITKSRSISKEVDSTGNGRAASHRCTSDCNHSMIMKSIQKGPAKKGAPGSETMAYSTILYETSDDGVATITLNRPDRLNAFNRTMGADFRTVWTEIREDKAVRAVVLRAAGDRAFNTGADVQEGGWARADIGPFDATDPGPSLGAKQNLLWKPVVCAVHGMCAGGAFYFLNEADVVICSEDATFFDPHVNFGMVCAVEPTGLLGRMNRGEIMRMILLGNYERILAHTALRIGLVTEITPRETLWERAHELAAIMASMPAPAIQGTVKAMWEAQDLPYSIAVKNALKYTQLGNNLEKVDRSSAPKIKWTPR